MSDAGMSSSDETTPAEQPGISDDGAIQGDPLLSGPTLLAHERGPLDAAPIEVAKKRTLGIGFWVCISWLILIIVLAIAADWLPLRSPTERSIVRELGRPPYAPSSDFWFGSDKDARDLLSRCIFGARVSLVIGFTSIAFGFIVGGALGTLAGYFRGWVDRVVSFAFLVLLSFPTTVLAVFITSIIERTVFTLSLTIGVLSVAPIGRLARATTLQYADREFVIAARTLGARHPRIIMRELFPNVVIPMGALALLGVSVAIVAEGTLAFLGLSVEDGLSWGTLISFGATSDAFQDSPWMAIFPIGLLFLTVASLNYAGDRVRKYFDVRESVL